MVERTFPCVFLSRTYSSYAICTKKKKKNIEETLRYSPSKDQPSRRLITQRTFARKKEKKKNHPSRRSPTPRKIATRNLSERIVPRYACCREFFPSPSPLISLGLIVYLRSHPPRARKRLATSRNERCCAGDSLLCGSRCSPFDSSPFLFLDPPHASFDLISIKRVHTFCLARGGGYIFVEIYRKPTSGAAGDHLAMTNL